MKLGKPASPTYLIAVVLR